MGLYKIFLLGVRCPKCLSHAVIKSDIQSWEYGTLWECTHCRYNDLFNLFIQKEPPGVITVTHGEDVPE